MKWALTWGCASIFVGVAFGFSGDPSRFDVAVIAVGMGAGTLITGIYMWVDRSFPTTRADETGPD